MPRWTAEARRRQSELIRQVEPWKRSTGPKTRSGKRRSAQNSLKTGEHTAIARSYRVVMRLLGIDLSSLQIPDEPDTAAIEQDWKEFFRNVDPENELFKSN